jgi:hypothetical protein
MLNDLQLSFKTALLVSFCVCFARLAFAAAHGIAKMPNALAAWRRSKRTQSRAVARAKERPALRFAHERRKNIWSAAHDFHGD